MSNCCCSFFVFTTLLRPSKLASLRPSELRRAQNVRDHAHWLKPPKARGRETLQGPKPTGVQNESSWLPLSIVKLLPLLPGRTLLPGAVLRLLCRFSATETL